MREPEPGQSSRRELFASGARLLALGGMAAYAVTQSIKTHWLENDPNCIRLYTCNECVEFAAGCSLPKADKFREQKGQGKSV